MCRIFRSRWRRCGSRWSGEKASGNWRDNAIAQQHGRFAPGTTAEGTEVNRGLFDLRGKMAMVTGASKGLGRAMAIGLALSLIHISEPTRLGMISYAVF